MPHGRQRDSCHTDPHYQKYQQRRCHLAWRWPGTANKRSATAGNVGHVLETVKEVMKQHLCIWQRRKHLAGSCRVTTVRVVTSTICSAIKGHDLPNHMVSSSGPLTEMKLAWHSLAIAFASSVLPQPAHPEECISDEHTQKVGAQGLRRVPRRRITSALGSPQTSSLATCQDSHFSEVVQNASAAATSYGRRGQVSQAGLSKLHQLQR